MRKHLAELINVKDYSTDEHFKKLFETDRLPATSCYQELCKRRAQLLLEREEELKAAYYLSETHSVTLRRQILYRTNQNIRSRQNERNVPLASSNEISPGNKENNSQSKQDSDRTELNAETNQKASCQQQDLLEDPSKKTKQDKVEGDKLSPLRKHEKRTLAALNKISLSEKDSFQDTRRQLVGFEENSSSTENEEMMLQQLETLPEEWTVLQLTSVPTAASRFNQEHEKSKTPALYITRFHCGSKKDAFVFTVPAPREDGSCSGLLKELEDILLRNSTELSKLGGNRVMYWKERERLDCRMKQMVYSMSRSWFHAFECLFQGHLVEKNLQKKLDQIVKKILTAVSLKLTPKNALLFEKLVEGFALLSLTNALKGIAECLKISPLDSKCKEVYQEIKKHAEILDKINLAKRHPVLLILDKKIHKFPWEMLPMASDRPFSRVPSLRILLTLHKANQKPLHTDCVDPNSAFYILNPSCNLPGTEERMKKYLSSKTSWPGITGQEPTSEQFAQALLENDILLYCGHGSGRQYISGEKLQKLMCRAIPVLMGCSSCSLKQQGPRSDPYGTTDHFSIANSPSVVGMLYSVSDVDCDRVTVKLLDSWLLEECNTIPNLLEAVAEARNSAKQYLTAASLVVYGLPSRAACK